LEPECQVRLESFEGPLDLLLHLIQKNKLDITDIPIALVTSQYLEYLEFMKALDVVVAGEYLVMAATLMHIKSRLLLPRHNSDENEEDDPRLEIVRPLQELVHIRKASELLEKRPLLGRDVFLGSVQIPDMGYETEGDQQHLAPIFDVSLHQLITAFKQVLGNRSLPRVLEITRAKLSLSERMDTLQEMLNEKNRLSFFELFPSEDRQMIIVTFLAILEMAKLGKVILVQTQPGEDIVIYKRDVAALTNEQGRNE